MTKIALFLVGKKGVDVLQYIITNYKLLISDVISGQDSGIDRDYCQEIEDLCIKHNIMHHERITSNFSVEKYNGLILAIGWRWMLPVNESLVIFHDSLLPKYRGFAPLVNCLVNGEAEIGATALFAGKKYDTGQIIAQASKKINYPIKIRDAIQFMTELYIQLASDLLNKLTLGLSIESSIQNEALTTYSLWRDDEDYWIDWNKSAEEIVRFIDAVGSPYSGARCLVNGYFATIDSAKAIPDLEIVDRKSSVGKVLFIENLIPVVICGKGLIEINKLISEDGEPLLPLVKFRTRFSSKK